MAALIASPMTMLVDLTLAAANNPWLAIQCLSQAVVIVGVIVGFVVLLRSGGPRT